AWAAAWARLVEPRLAAEQAPVRGIASRSRRASQPAGQPTTRFAVACRPSSFADANHERIQVRGTQARMQAIDLGEVRERTDAHAIPDVVVDGHALHAGVDALQ